MVDWNKKTIAIIISGIIIIASAFITVQYRYLPSYAYFIPVFLVYSVIVIAYFILQTRKKIAGGIKESAEESEMRFMAAKRWDKFLGINVFALADMNKSEYTVPISISTVASRGEMFRIVWTFWHTMGAFKNLRTWVYSIINQRGEFLVDRMFNAEWGYDRTTITKPEIPIYEFPRSPKLPTPEEFLIKKAIEEGSLPKEIIKISDELEKQKKVE